MGFTEAIVSVFKNYANFNGRARRSEFWYFTLFCIIVEFILDLLSGGDALSIFSVLYLIFSLGVLVPSLAVCWRRLHDIGKSGAYWCFSFIPLIGWILLLIWFVRDSDLGSNRFGPNPKGQNPPSDGPEM